MSYSDEKSLPQPAFYMMNCLGGGPWRSLAPHFKDFGVYTNIFIRIVISEFIERSEYVFSLSRNVILTTVANS